MEEGNSRNVFNNNAPNGKEDEVIVIHRDLIPVVAVEKVVESESSR